ncbi:hypothetical protein [Lentzea flaviverrucosa]|uniref:PD-(D/E)XK nuclease superfamily protein n=1 Tax=Lentzea flaviverrucosa TaxID=200379 RepID=A0A1H9SH15_9PSEU|nr:hypothetical protein [Lentzea flaviverrucosa]RDI25371.1 hypothetical protein DFR72_10863 [Lentzea flaviverrucosa]SER84336.1 hypothetical protein SAMN05216195_10764 [Lentzea flaviverrucosa]
MSSGTATDLEGQLTAILTAGSGQPSIEDAFAALGGWERLARDAAALADSPVLPPLVHLVTTEAADSDRRTDSYAEAMRGVSSAVTSTTSPAILIDSLETLITSGPALNEVGDLLAAALEATVQDFLGSAEPDNRFALRAAGALEARARLALCEIGSPFALLALLERFDAPLPKPLGTAVVRAVGVAVDRWPFATGLITVVRRLAGIDPPPLASRVRADADPEDVASDASWVLAGIELVSALRAANLPAMQSKLESSAKYLRLAQDTYEREDASVLLAVVDILCALLGDSVPRPRVEALSTPRLEPQALADLAERVRRINVTSMGLNHWYGEPKRAALLAWSRLADDLGSLREEFKRDSFYKAEVVVDNLLQIYLGSRSTAVVSHAEDMDGLLRLVQPVIESGFARTAGLLSNLEDHTLALEQEAVSATGDREHEVTEKLAVARAVLRAARSQALAGAEPGKADSGTAPAPLPQPLRQLVPPGSAAAIGLTVLPPEALAELAEAISNATIGKHSLNLIEDGVYASIQNQLESSPDYAGEPKEAVNDILRLIIQFASSRLNGQSDLFPYLFDPKSVEKHIHQDLLSFLRSSHLGAITEFEVQHVGGGRIDLRLKFSGFGIYIEMKTDSTKKPLSDKQAYLKQAVTYQVSDIRIGFLISLRHKAFDLTGAPPHLSALVGHTVFDVPGDPIARHVVTVGLPGSRTKPSEMR